MGTLEVLAEIGKERERQDVKWGEQNHQDGTGGQMREFAAMVARGWCDKQHETNSETWLDILNEEMAEAFAESDEAKLRKELVQVAAVAVAWIEAIDRRQERRKQAMKSCNRHNDCEAADEEARYKGYLYAEHCHDDCCEECFGY